ncbi:orotidine-5'-phosphate decarboxylase [Thermovibrio sp.]
METKLIVALDFSSKEEALKLVDELSDAVEYYKVGLELFSREGRGILRELSKRGKKVFLDLKYHDIPNTVKSAAKVAIEEGVWLYNLHALGGRRLMEELSLFNREYAQKLGIERPLVIAVTVLTSMGEEDLKEIGIEKGIEEEVINLAKLSKESGLDGVVCSPREVRRVKESLGEEFLTITPGVRPSWAKRDDQKRILTPKQAKELKTDFIVVGRPITRAPNPKEAALKILKELL